MQFSFLLSALPLKHLLSSWQYPPLPLESWINSLWGSWAAAGAPAHVCGGVRALVGCYTQSGSPAPSGAADGSGPSAASAASSAACAPVPAWTRRGGSAWRVPSLSGSSSCSAPREDREERKEEGSMDDLQCGVLLFDQLVFNETFSHVEINFLLFGFKLRILATAEKSIHITHEILSLSCFKLNTSFSP